MSPPTDDSLMNRFDEHGLRRFRARDAIVAVTLAALLLVLFAGAVGTESGRADGPGRRAATSCWPSASRRAGSRTGCRSPTSLTTRRPGSRPTRSSTRATPSPRPPTRPAATPRVPPVTADAFDPARIGAKPGPKRQLRTLLVTGDSMSTPLDAEMARLLAGDDVRVIREPHLGTGISKSFLVDWGQLSARQVKRDHPNAVVVFIGANEGFPMKGAGGREVQCCGAEWAAAYANRVRRMVDTYRQQGAARVYWIGLPPPRAAAGSKISRVVNEAVEVATQPWRGAGPGRRHERDLHPARLPRRDGRGRRGDDRARTRRHPPQRAGLEAAGGQRCWSRSARTTCTSADSGLTLGRRDLGSPPMTRRLPILPSPSRRPRCCSATATAGAGGVTRTAARSCSVPDYPGSGYFTSLTVKGASCATGRKLALRLLPLPHALGARGPMPQARAPLLLP